MEIAKNKCLECGDPSTLKCPTCLKNGLPDSYYCTQTCFKKSWATHKAAHPKTTKPYDPFPTFPYTGLLRAIYPLSPKREVPAHITRPDYADRSDGNSMLEQADKQRLEVLSKNDEESVRKACKIAAEVLDIAGKAVKVGITTDEIDRIVHEATIERNAYPSPLNYYQFPKSCCTSVNEIICHGIPDQYVLKDGDIVNIDVTCYIGGFHGDVNATYLVGNVDEDGRKLVTNARECLEKAIATIKPGTLYRDIGKTIEAHARSEGLSVVRTYCGHGIHRLFHCAPNVPHYARNKAVGACKPGHVFTIEPMINEGVWNDKTWPDKWTAATLDGKRSAQFEHTLLVTEDGVEILTTL